MNKNNQTSLKKKFVDFIWTPWAYVVAVIIGLIVGVLK